MADELLVLTPEKTVVTYELAGLPARIGAHFLDLIIGLALAGTASKLLAPLTFGWEPEAAQGLIGFVSVSLFLGYFVFCEALFQGKTAGKSMSKIRVIMADGTPVTFMAAMQRNLLRPADFFPIGYLVGAVSLFISPRSQRLGDIAAGTVVASSYGLQMVVEPAPYRVGVHPLEHTVGELRTMTLPEYHALKRLVDRFPFLPQEAQGTMVQEVWSEFAKVHSVKPIPGVHPLYQMEAVVMKFGRQHRLL